MIQYLEKQTSCVHATNQREMTMEPIIINNETELREACREVVYCSARASAENTDRMLAACLAATDRPAYGTDWAQWWEASEDARWASLAR